MFVLASRTRFCLASHLLKGTRKDRKENGLRAECVDGPFGSPLNGFFYFAVIYTPGFGVRISWATTPHPLVSMFSNCEGNPSPSNTPDHQISFYSGFGVRQCR